MGRFPDKKVLLASYGSTIAAGFGRKVRNLTETDEYKVVFPDAGLASDSKAKGEWELANGSAFFACGVGSAVTSKRGDLAIIDDPVKGRKEADSEVVRKATWDWYLSDLTSRLKPGAATVIIQTRWHEKDLSGMILPDGWDGESGWVETEEHGRWYVVCLPAEAKEHDILGRQPGEWLWPEWFTPAWWEAKKKTQPPRNWSSLYQQSPTPDEGSYFKRDWFWRYDIRDIPSHAKLYQTADFAVTDAADADDPDFTEIGVHGVTQDEDGMPRLYLLKDGYYGQNDPDTWVNEYFNLVKRHRPLCEFAEVGVIRRATEGLLKRTRRARRAIGRIEWVSHIGDKVANARALQNMASMGQVGIPNGDAGDRLLEQLLKFPAAAHDDGVDMAAMIARVIDEAHPGVKRGGRSKPVQDRWDKAFDEDDSEESWRI